MMLQPLKRLIRSTSRALGYDIMPLRDIKDRDFAIHLGQLFRHLDIDCVLDVGANTGQYHDFLREQVPYAGRIISFEPVRQNIEILRQRQAADAKWTVLGHALGSSRSRATINVMKSDQFSSFRTPDNAAVPEFEGLNETSHSELVEIHRLDDILPALQARHGFRNIYLKVDTQGFDLEVLAGAAASLPAIRALQTEASIIGIYRDMPDYMQTIRYLNERDFDISGLYPISRDPAMRLIEFDCVMVNRRASVATAA